MPKKKGIMALSNNCIKPKAIKAKGISIQKNQIFGSCFEKKKKFENFTRKSFNRFFELGI
jgi:hypothetical protein